MEEEGSPTNVGDRSPISGYQSGTHLENSGKNSRNRTVNRDIEIGLSYDASAEAAGDVGLEPTSVTWRRRTSRGEKEVEVGRHREIQKEIESEYPPEQTQTQPKKQRFHLPPRALHTVKGVMLIDLSQFFVAFVIPLVVFDFDESGVAVGLASALITTGNLLAGLLVGHLANRRERMRFLVPLGAALKGVSNVAVYLFSALFPTLPALFLSLFCLGFASASVFVCMKTLVCDYSSLENRSESLGGLAFYQGIAIGIGSTIGFSFFNVAGPLDLGPAMGLAGFAVFGLLNVVGSVYMWFSIKKLQDELGLELTADKSVCWENRVSAEVKENDEKEEDEKEGRENLSEKCRRVEHREIIDLKGTETYGSLQQKFREDRSCPISVGENAIEKVRNEKSKRQQLREEDSSFDAIGTEEDAEKNPVSFPVTTAESAMISPMLPTSTDFSMASTTRSSGSAGHRPSLRREFPLLVFGLLLTFLSIEALVGSLVRPFLSLFLSQSVADEAYLISLAYMPGGILSVILSPWLGRLGDRLGPRRVLPAASFLGACVTALFTSVTAVWQAALILLVDFSVLVLADLVLSKFVSSLSFGRRGSAMGWVAAGRAAGSLVGPLLGGVLWEEIGTKAPFFFSAGVEAALALAYFVFFSIVTLTDRESRAEEQLQSDQDRE